MSPAPPRALLAALAALAMLAAVAVVRYGEPRPRDASAPSDAFSAARAVGFRREVLGQGASRPVGSVEGVQARARIVAVLRRLGYAPEVQTRWQCNGAGTCATVGNVLARLEGQSERAVLLAAHYDSVPAGPGASDDGAGVAVVLETARALRAGPPPRNPVVFLLDDGEEIGLLGALAFARTHPWAREVAAMVNLEARGTGGASLMFETARDNAWLVRLLAVSLPRPVTSSAFFAVYERLPNDTDFTVFRAHGVQGANFAFIAGPLRYHSPLDDEAHASAGSLQHQGDHALATIRALAAADLARPPRGDAVWFDVLALVLVVWPAGWTPWLAGAALVGALMVAAVLARRGVLEWRGLVWGALGWLAAPGIAAVLAAGATWLLHAVGALPAPWITHPLPGLVGCGALGLAVALEVGLRASRRSGAVGALLGGAMGWGAVAVLVAALAPELSYVFVVPALVAALASMRAVRPGARVAASLLTALSAGCVWFPMLRLLPDAVGVVAMPVLAALVALVASAVAPLCAEIAGRWRVALPGAAGVVALGALGIAALVPPFSEDAPQQLDLMFHLDADAGTARWIADSSFGPAAGALPAEVRRVVAFAARPVATFPWAHGTAWVAPAPTLVLPTAHVEITVQDSQAPGRRVVLSLAPAREGGRVMVALPPGAGLMTARANGAALPTEGEPSANGWRLYLFAPAPGERVTLDLLLAGAAPVEAQVMDVSFGLPPEGTALLRARPRTAVPRGNGDVTVVSHRVRL